MKKIVLYFAETADISPENIPMSPARRARLDRLRHPGAREQHAASSAALYAALGSGALTFEYGENGRPQVTGACVSCAHTDGMAVCALSDVPAGCDIEKTGRRLTPAMQAQFGSLDDWLALEACAKMTGEGLSGIKKYRRSGDAMLDENGRRAAYVRLLEYGGYSLAVCCGEDFEINIAE